MAREACGLLRPSQVPVVIGGTMAQDRWYGGPRTTGFIQGVREFCPLGDSRMIWLQTVDQYATNEQQMRILFRANPNIGLVYGEDEMVLSSVIAAAQATRKEGTSGLILATSTGKLFDGYVYEQYRAGIITMYSAPQRLVPSFGLVPMIAQLAYCRSDPNPSACN